MQWMFNEVINNKTKRVGIVEIKNIVTYINNKKYLRSDLRNNHE